MKKVLFVIPTMRIGGAEKALVSLLNRLDPAETEVDLFLFEQGGPLQNQIPEWVNILPEDRVTRAMTLEFRYYWKDLLRAHRFSAALARAKLAFWPAIRARLRMKKRFSWKTAQKHIAPLDKTYDAAIGFLEGTTGFFVLDKVHAARKIGWIHTDFRGRKLLDEEIACYRRFDEIATITPSCRESFLEATGFAPENCHIIENISDASSIHRLAEEPVDLYWDESMIHLLTVGRLEYQKGTDLAFETCKRLVQAGERICWHVLGDGSMRQWLESASRASGLEDRFILEGVTANPYPYMKKAFAIVQTSRVEGKSIVLDEAKILGKAIVATNYPSVGDQLTEGETGLIAEMDPEAIAACIRRLINDRHLRQALAVSRSTGEETTRIISLFYQMVFKE